MREILNKSPFVAVVLAASALCGCPNPNTYATPRTVAPGRFAHSVSLEGLGYRNTVQGDDDTTEETETEYRAGGFVPTFPSYQLRIGIADQFDIGAHVHNLSSIGADFKYNPIRGIFDLAIDPGFQWFAVGGTTSTGPGQSEKVSTHVFYFHVPLMMAVNPTDWFTVVLTPGFTYGLFTSDVFGEAATRSIDGAMFRGSLGFQFRIGERFAIHPEISLLKSFEGAGTVINAGLGFNFGSIPGYKDLSEDPEMPERPRPGAPPPGAAPMSAPMPAPMPASAPMPAPAAAPPT